ncbi:hypothetical protein [Campylobacter fetus]|uniref:hypothetical protein n=1 Tax=Campylobacter fetus TaxID=196 RepID=UPI000FCBF09C|nr:hypothetical protein [Campylobacter fetus]QQF51329.1 hypothetical protein HHI31_00165 [Campylobacter fetus subsp. venerealis]RUT48869.1 hypothetical protein BWK67_09005 [Campylobacter fetus]RUT48991.1 hypothetical protein BWK51_08980 [Campylobacter fetus]
MQSITIQGNDTIINAILELVKGNPNAKVIKHEAEQPKTYNSIEELKADYGNRVNEVLNGTVKLYSAQELIKECEQW